MREDPDVVMVGEMRDTDTVEAALNLAETGHLVFSTLHTSGSVQTISRIVQFFSPDQQRQIFTRLADSILGVLSQRLVPRRDGSNKRIALFELMLVNSGIKNLIRSGDLAQVNNAIQMGRSEGNSKPSQKQIIKLVIAERVQLADRNKLSEHLAKLLFPDPFCGITPLALFARSRSSWIKI
jgi:twitching motility protein PilT